MPVNTGVDSWLKQEPKCWARWGEQGKKYYYTCGDDEAREKAKAKALIQGQAIIVNSETKIKGGLKTMKVSKDRNRNQSMEGKIDLIRKQIYDLGESCYLICTFEDAVIYEDTALGKLYEMFYAMDTEGKVVFGEPKEVSETYVQKRIFSESFDFSDLTKVKEAHKGIESLIETWGSWAGDYDGCIKALSDKPGITNPEALCAWMHFEAEGVWPGEKAKAEKGAELTGPIVFKNDEQRIVFAAVLVPGEPDFDYDKGEKILTKEEIQRVAWKWLEDYSNIDVMHGLNNVAIPVESYLLPVKWNVTAYGKSMELPEGTWIMGSRVKDDVVWKDVKEEKLTGFSVMGIPKTALKGIIEKAAKGINIADEFNAALKRVLIKDLGADWLAPFVSIVDEPCVPKAKFFAIKSKDIEIDEVKKKGILEKIKDAFTVEKKGRVISDATFGDLKKAWESLGKLITKAEGEREKESSKQKESEIEMTNEEIQVLVEKAINEKLKPLSERLELITNKLAEMKEPEPEPEPAPKAVEPTEEELAKKAKDEDIVSKLQEKVKELDEFIKKGKSNAIRGDDNLTVKDEKEIDDNRDPLGRAKKKRY